MRPIRFNLATNTSQIVPLDQRAAPPFQVEIECEVVTAATYGVEATLDDVQDPTVTPLWFPVDAVGLAAGATTTQRGLQTTPCTALRVSKSAGAGSINVTIFQQGTK